MYDYPTLTIQRKLSKTSGALYWELFAAHKNGESLDAVLRRNKIEPELFGRIRFFETTGSVYYEHIPVDHTELGKVQLHSEMDIQSTWLMCFAFKDMNVLGFIYEMGVFEAATTVDYALDWLSFAEISDYELYQQRDQLRKWIKQNATPDDRLYMCSNWLFYHEEQKYNYDYVRNFINNRIASLKEVAHCMQWRKGQVEKPTQMKMEMTA